MFERVYSVVVAVKGFDGAVELLAGLTFLVAPRLVSSALESLAGELAEGASPLRAAAAHSIAGARNGLLTGAVPFALFLLVHGVVKLVTVYALLRRALRWYPWALLALIALFLVQIVALITAPTITSWVFVGLDVLIIALVAWEYVRLRKEPFEPTESARAHRSKCNARPSFQPRE